MREYAHSLGADFLAVVDNDIASAENEDTREIPFGKLSISDLFGVYDRILYLDGDILVRPGAPDVFTVVPKDQIGATRVDHLPLEFAPAIRDGGVKQDIDLSQKIFGELGWEEEYFNSGVLVLSAPHREMLEHCRKHSGEWVSEKSRAFNDQTLINYWTYRLQIPVYDLGRKYNHTPAFNWQDHRYNSYFIHYAGFRGHRRGNRYRQMLTDRWIYQHPNVRRLLANQQKLAHCLDWALPFPEKLIAPWRLIWPREERPASFFG